MKIFILYAQRDQANNQRALNLANQLRSDGFHSIIDRYVTALPTIWAEWSFQQMEIADAIIIICSDELVKRFQGQLEGERGRGARYEGRLLSQALYQEENWHRFIPVFVEEANREAAVPRQLSGMHRYVLWNDYQALLWRLRGEPAVAVPPVASTPIPTRIPMLPGWAEVSFEPARDLRAALRGESLGPRDVNVCPELAEVEELVRTLHERHVAALIGPSGSGKSMTAFHVAARLHREGRPVLQFVDAATAVTSATRYLGTAPASVLLVDNAHLLARQTVEALAHLASENMYVLLIATERLPGRLLPVQVDSRRAVKTMADAFHSRTDELLPLVREIDPRIGVRYLQTPIERVLADAAKADAPWKFMFVLGRGDLRVGDAIRMLQAADDAHVLLFALAVSQIAAWDGGVEHKRLAEFAARLGRDDEWLQRSLEALQQQGLLDRRGTRLSTPHPRVALSVLDRLVLSLCKQFEAVPWFVRRVLGDSSFPLRGRAWLLRELNFAWSFTLPHFVDDEVRASLWNEILSARDEDSRAASAWMVSALLYGGGDTPSMQRVAAAPDWLVEWIDTATSHSGYPLGEVVNDLVNHDREGAARLVAKTDPRKLAARLNRPSPDISRGLAYLLDRLIQEAAPVWRQTFLEGLDVHVLSEHLEAWPDDRLWELAHLLNTLLWLDTSKAALALDALAAPIQRGFMKDVLATWSHLSKVIQYGMGFSPLFEERRPKKEIRDIARKIACLVEPVRLARSISASQVRDWEPLGHLAQWIRDVAPQVAAKAAPHIDLEPLIARAEPLWETMPRDLEMLLATLALDAHYEPAATMLRRCQDKVQDISTSILAIAPDVVEHVFRKSARVQWGLAGGMPRWKQARALLESLASRAPELAQRSLESASSELADGMLLRQANGMNGCRAFLKAAMRIAPSAVATACTQLKEEEATRTWTARLNDKQDVRAALHAVLRIVETHEGPARELARRLLETMEHETPGNATGEAD